jgi:NADH-quinone oxidoreductase subunit J
VAQAAGKVVEQYSNTKELGKLLYSQYLYPLEIAAVILLVAMIAAIALTLRERKDSKHMDPSQQVRVKARDRFEVVKLAATRPAQEPVAAPVEEKKA